MDRRSFGAFLAGLLASNAFPGLEPQAASAASEDLVDEVTTLHIKGEMVGVQNEAGEAVRMPVIAGIELVKWEDQQVGEVYLRIEKHDNTGNYRFWGWQDESKKVGVVEPITDPSKMFL